jgi:hypothetical protein
VTDWSRYNRIELELAQARHRVGKLEDELISMGLDLAHALGTINTLTQERDTARRVAMRLEEENHLLALDTVLVPLRGEAR